jgi:hypothetical protein
MPVNGVTVGVDYQFGLYDSNSGSMVDLGIIENVKITARKHDIKAQPYNAPPVFGYIEDGYSIAFTLQRTSSKLENIGLDLANAFNAGKSISAGYFLETVTDADGTVYRYRYDGFVFHLTEVADVSREKTVKQTVDAMASSKTRIA